MWYVMSHVNMTVFGRDTVLGREYDLKNEHWKDDRKDDSERHSKEHMG